ncbi:threonine dehydratase [Magnetovibrio sp.]|uniref:threonine dehydratase n=1 Tax=Magnetovibrio sp. TaxID=2024836 RepID=UPI002F940703
MDDGMLNATIVELEATRAIVYRHMSPTPAYTWPLLSQRTGCEVWVKHENHTPVGAFKVRGGLVYLSGLKATQPDIKGVISATRGNHGQSLAFAAGKLGMKAVIVVPEGNSPDKNRAMQALGAELIVHGADFQEALEYTQKLAEERGLYMIGPFEKPLMRGVATYALEFFEQAGNLDAIYVPIGMGSGICGLISVRDALGLKTEIVGVVAEGAPAYALSFEKGEVVSTNTAETIADGVACRVPSPEAFEIIKNGAARVVRVSDDEIMDAMGMYFTDTHNLAEGAAATPLAGLMKEKDLQSGRKVGLILSGGNADRDTFARVMEHLGA